MVNHQTEWGVNTLRGKSIVTNFREPGTAVVYGKPRFGGISTPDVSTTREAVARTHTRRYAGELAISFAP